MGGSWKAKHICEQPLCMKNLQYRSDVLPSWIVMNHNAARDLTDRDLTNTLQFTERLHERPTPFPSILEYWHTDANPTIALMDEAVQFIPHLMAYTHYKP